MERQISSTSSFKLFLIRFLVPSVLVVGVFAVAFDYLFEKKIIFNSPISGAFKIYRNKNVTEPGEIPIFGSSRAAGSYIPDLIDSNCYNYGIEKTEHALIKVFLKNEFAKNKSTPIIINFDYETWSDWIGDHANYIPNLDDDKIKTLFGKNDKWYYHVKGIRYYGYYQYYFKNYFSNKSDKNYINKGGFFLKEKTPLTDLNEEIEARKKSPVEYKNGGKAEDEFIDLLSQNKGRKIFLVIAPYHPSFMQTLKGKPVADMFFERVRKLPDVYVLDYSVISYPDTLYKNTTHLNYLGAQKFSRELKEKLHEIAPDYFN